MRAIVPLESEPRFRPFPFATPLDGPIRRAVDDAALVLSRTLGRFDGPIAFCHGVARDGAILRRRGRYAEAMVVFAEPSQAYRLGFALGVQLFVDPLSYQYLDGTQIDYVETTHGPGFKIGNPNAKSTCGCGESFTA